MNAKVKDKIATIVLYIISCFSNFITSNSHRIYNI